MRHILTLICLLVATPALAQTAHVLPDPTLTPGDAIAGVTAADICHPGYARSVRNVPAALRRQVFAAYGMPEGNHSGYCAGPQGCELDHLISLELGGSNAATNLFPQPYDGPWNARVKDRLENRLHNMVCAGEMPLAEAQQAIATDWIVAYRKYVELETFAAR
jgi:hypothetical protein